MTSEHSNNVYDIIERLKIATHARNDAELARLLGVGASRISMWKKRGVIDLMLINQKFDHINTAWLLRGTGEMMLDGPAPAAMGLTVKRPQLVGESQESVRYEQNPTWNMPAIGPLMTPEKIKEGDTLIIDPAILPDENDFVLVKTPDGPAIKRFDGDETPIGVVVRLIREHRILRQ